MMMIYILGKNPNLVNAEKMDFKCPETELKRSKYFLYSDLIFFSRYEGICIFSQELLGRWDKRLGFILSRFYY